MGLQKKGWKTYSHYGEDMQMSLNDFKREVTRWRHLWRMSEDGNLQTLVETLDYTNVELYPGIYVVMTTLLTYPVSTCVVEVA